MKSLNSPQNVRLTITVTPQVHQAFQRLAKASSMPTGRAMGDWLGDTVEAAEFMATNIEKARAAPKLVAKEMHAYALGLADETGDLLKRLREKGQAARTQGDASAPPGAGRSAQTPPSNTGVTPTKNKPNRGTK